MASSQNKRKRKNKKEGEEKKLRLFDLLNKKTLIQAQNSYMDYLQSSAAILDADGKYLLARIASPYCRFLNHASLKQSPSFLRKHKMVSEKYLCHHNCYHLSLRSMKAKHPFTKKCPGGIMILAAPIVVDGETLGCINAGISSPPADDKTIKRIANRFCIDPKKLLNIVKRHTQISDYIFQSAKKHILKEAETIADACRRKILEMQVKEMTLDLESKNRVLDCIHQIEQELEKGVPLKRVLKKVVSGKASSSEGRELLFDIAHLISQALERRKLERILHETKGGCHNILDHANDGIIVANQSGEITFFNKKAEEMLGYEAREILGKDVFSIVPQKYRAEGKKDRNNFLKTGVSRTIGKAYEAAALSKDGIEIPVEISFSVFKTADAYNFMGVLRDIAERKKAELQVREARDFLEKVIESSMDGIIISDAEGNIIYVNESVEKITGLRREEVIGRHISMFTPSNGKLRKRVKDELVSKLFSEGKVALEAVFQRKDGALINIDQTSTLIKDDGGNYIGGVSIIRDITAKKEAEKELKETRKFLESVIEYSMDGIIVCDPTGSILSVNSAVENMSGYSRKELTNQHISLLAPEDKRIRREILERQSRLFTNGVANFEATWEKKDGSRIDIEQSVSFIKNDKGDNVAGVSIARDITEKKSLERQLLQSQKMETIGTLAGGIAHDFNNILGGILGYSSFIKTLIKEENQVYKYIDTIEASAIRAADLTSQLLSFSRGGKYESKALDINKTIEETLRILYSSIDKSISIKTMLNPQLLNVEGDANQIQQVFLNLFVNARDAMPGGGTLQIETKNVYLDEAFCKTHLGAKPDQYVYIAISDTGMGINQETLDRIFEPFFSTKGQGKGTGLGLSVVYGIIKNHSGYINVYSELGKGSIFKVYLPASSKPILEEEEAEISNVKGEESILVIDDEEVIRDLVEEGLEDFGYTVLTAENGEIGINMYKDKDREIDLVILDLILPRMSGKITYEKLKEIDPEITVLLSSGYSQRGQAQELLDRGVQGFIQKPFRLKELAREIRVLLDRRNKNKNNQ